MSEPRCCPIWGCVALALALPVGVFLRGLALVYLWGWFVVPFGLPPVSMPWAFGLAATAYLFTGQHVVKPSDDEAEPWLAVAKGVVWLVGLPLLTIGFGWFWHLWM